jgi:hypothetical protein
LFSKGPQIQFSPEQTLLEMTAGEGYFIAARILLDKSAAFAVAPCFA